MKFDKLSVNVIIGVLFSILFGAQASVCQTTSSNLEKQVKFLGKEKQEFGDDIVYQLSGSRIVARFAPKNSLGESIEVQKLARDLGYDHFNWTNYVVKDPYGITDRMGQRLNTPYNDPPVGGYLYDPADKLPFYWDLEQCQQCKSRHHWQHQNNLKQFELVFEDFPADYRLQPGEKIEFVTNLVGVKEYNTQTQMAKWEILHTFRWQLTNPHPHLSQVSLIETNVALDRLSPMLLSTMQLDGAVLQPFSLNKPASSAMP